MIGCGKYNDNLTAALQAAGARQGILIVLDGREGGGFAMQTSPEVLAALPVMLRSLAALVESEPDVKLAQSMIGPRS